MQEILRAINLQRHFYYTIPNTYVNTFLNASKTKMEDNNDDSNLEKTWKLLNPLLNRERKSLNLFESKRRVSDTKGK